ncbi:MAG: 2-C-methyl-D-erythritol 4-phosphate cytidylyltransferase [Chlorobi bacterium]|nr:2-C-methyl-D-erythritol 4-phosphate cytidylyltransferase [Chlorobiota bacterium]
MNFAVIIPSAGTGSRSGRDIPKQYVEILGLPVLAHTIRAFSGFPGCAEIIIPIDERWRDVAVRCAAGIDIVTFVAGGNQRGASIANGLAVIGREVDLVLVHDAARPCVSRDLVARVLEAGARYGAAIPALPINETVKRVDEQEIILETIPRGSLRAAQTPQCFRRDLLERAYAHAAHHDIVATDDASLVEELGEEVRVVEGEWENLKITLPIDFERAEKVLMARLC